MNLVPPFPMPEPSHLWRSKWLFILAAIGAAAGLGNLWRFPYMVYENGGSVFMIAYIVCLFILVVPLVIMEVAFGQTERKEIVSALGSKAGWFGRFVGWMLILLLFAVLGYYTTVVAWGVDYLYHSPNLNWGSNAEVFFFENILQFTDDPFVFGKFSVPIVLGLLVSYVAVYFSIFKGIKSISKVIQFTVPLPFILLLVLLINSFTLPGSNEGFRYLLVPEWSKLLEISLWKNAVSQSFMSANVGMVMTFMYASFNPKKTNIAQSAFLIAMGNAAVSFLAAFAIFGTLGYTAKNLGVPITEVVASGPTLAFIAFPNALATLPFGNGFFAVIFFLTVFTLAIDTVFAVTEAVLVSVRSEFSKLQKTFSRETLLFFLCAALFGTSLLYAGGNGLLRLDVMDHALWAHLLYWTVIPEILLIGWFAPVEKLRKSINAVSRIKIGKWFNLVVKFVAPAFLLALYVSSLPSELAENYGDYPTEFLRNWMWAPLIGIVVVSALLALRSSRKARLVD